MSEKDLVIKVVDRLYELDGHQMNKNQLIEFVGDRKLAVHIMKYLSTIKDGKYCRIIDTGTPLLYLDIDEYDNVIDEIDQHYEEQFDQNVDKWIGRVTSVISAIKP